MEAPTSLAVLRFGAVGDVLLTAPALEALRQAWPKTRILFVVKEPLRHLVAHNPDIDEAITLRSRRGIGTLLARRLRARGDSSRARPARQDPQSVDAGPSRRFALGDPAQAHIWLRPWAVKLARRPYHAAMPFADRYHAAVEEAVGRSLPRGKLRYHLGPDDQRLGDELLEAVGIDFRRPLLGLSPGAGKATKRWPAERFGALAVRALQAGLQLFVQGTEQERTLAGAIRELAPAAVDLTGRLDLATLGGVLSRCTAFVTNDSGPMHMARGLGVPTLAIFGSTDPGMFEFVGHRALVACKLPCWRFCSFFGRSRCLEGHPVAACSTRAPRRPGKP